jgi:hypothetical protein
LESLERLSTETDFKQRAEVFSHQNRHHNSCQTADQGTDMIEAIPKVRSASNSIHLEFAKVAER